VRKTGTVIGGFVALRTAILNRMGNRLDNDARTKLSGMTIDSDLPAIQGFKASFLNQVLFASLDLLRCEFEMSGACVDADGGVGVALGWAHQSGTSWTWDCRFRHDWDVPVGVALALIGGRCTDPCELYREQLNELIHLFDIPVTPAPPDDPDPGPVEICYKRVGNRIVNICERVVDAPETLDMNRHREIYREKAPFPPRKPEETAELIYELPATDWAEAGTISLKGTIGKKTTNVVDELTKVLVDKGNTAPIKVISQNEVNKTAGYQAGITVSAADTLVFVEDGLKKVIGVGSIPANTTMRGAVAEVPRVAGLAEGADQAAKAALDTTATFTNRLNTVDQKVGGFETFQANFLSWQSTIDGRVGGLTNEIDSKALEAVGKYQLAMQSEIDERIGVAVNTLRVGLVDQMRSEILVVGGQVRTDAAKDLQVATTALRKDVEADQKQITNKVGDLDQHVAALSGDVQVATRDAERSNQRIDSVLTRARADTGAVGGTRFLINPEMVSMMGNMRTSIVAAATPAQRAKVNATLAESEDAFKALTEATAAGPVELETQREALATVLTSMTTAVEAAGAPAADVDRLRGDLGRVIHR
jgi:outer membrane murein-binding lipoprotein Lpp